MIDFIWPSGIAALLVLGACLVVRWRIRRLAVQMRDRFEDRLAVRERMALDLHDGLLQNTQGLVLRVQAVSNSLAPDLPARALLERTLDQADELIGDGLDHLLDLTVPIDTSIDLQGALSSAGLELARIRAVSFTTTTEGASRRLTPAARGEAYRVGRHVLLSAFSQQRLRSIHVTTRFDERELRLRFRIEPAESGAASARHLAAAQSEAAKLGARLDTWRHLGAGADIEVRIPSAVAYPHGSVRSCWSRINCLAQVE